MSFFKKLFGSGDDAQTFEPPSVADLEPFRMRIEDIFSISGRGTVVTGKIECGVIKVGDAVEISGGAGAPIKTKVTGIEMFRKLVDTAGAGDDVGCLLKGVGPQDVQRGQVLSKA